MDSACSTTSVSLKKRTRVFLAVCSLFKIPARTWHGIFRSDWSQRNKISLTRFLSRFYELPLSGCGPVWGFATIWSNCENVFFPFAKVSSKSVQTQIFMDVSLPLWKLNAVFYLSEIPFVGSKRAAIGMLVSQVPSVSHQEKWPWIHVS